MFYELYTSKVLLKLIRNHAAKLISVSKDLQTWTCSSYDTILLMMNTETLKALRQYWLQYFDPKTSGDDRRLIFHNSAMKVNGYKSEVEDMELLRHMTILFGPLAEKSLPVATSFIDSGCNMEYRCKNHPESEFLNPLFVYSVGSGNEFSINPYSSPFDGIPSCYIHYSPCVASRLCLRFFVGDITILYYTLDEIIFNNRL
jgi:hypothetical protein